MNRLVFRLVTHLIRSQAERLHDETNSWLDTFRCLHGEWPALEEVQKIVKKQSRKALRDWL